MLQQGLRRGRFAAAAQKLVPQLHEAVAARLRCQDQDQEVKECAIAAAATLAADLGDLLRRALPELLQVRRPPALPLLHAPCQRCRGQGWLAPGRWWGRG